MTLSTRTALTYRHERWRAVASGVLETAGTTFLLLIAVRWFHAGALAKAFIAGGGSLGFIFSPWIVSRVERLGWRGRGGVAPGAGGAGSTLAMAAVPILPVFVGRGWPWPPWLLLSR